MDLVRVCSILKALSKICRFYQARMLGFPAGLEAPEAAACRAGSVSLRASLTLKEKYAYPYCWRRRPMSSGVAVWLWKN